LRHPFRSHATRYTPHKGVGDVAAEERETHIQGMLKHFQVLQLRSAQEQVLAAIYRFAYHLSELLTAMLCGSNDTGR